jgi:hypothetical protein
MSKQDAVAEAMRVLAVALEELALEQSQRASMPAMVEVRYVSPGNTVIDCMTDPDRYAVGGENRCLRLKQVIEEPN